MTLIFCDFCGKELKSITYYFEVEMDYQNKSVSIGIDVRKDICEECLLRIIKKIKPDNILEQPDQIEIN